MSEQNRPRHKMNIDEEMDAPPSGEGSHHSGQSRTNILAKSKKKERKGSDQSWLPNT